MNQDPAFLFYSSDFLTGVSDLTMEERGQYITLLCLQHQKGRLSGKAVAIAVPDAAADVMAKFKQDENGLYYNERLEIEAEKRRAHAEKQRERALKGWEKRKNQNQSDTDTTANAAALPLENENENEIEDKSEKGKGDSKGKTEPAYKAFYREQWEEANGKPLGLKYRYIIKYLMNHEENVINEPGLHILKLKKQLSFKDYCKLHEYCDGRTSNVKDLIDSWLNKTDYSKGKVSVYATLRNWASKTPMRTNRSNESKSAIIATTIGQEK